MGRKRRKNTFQAGELNLTAMIDVAFQLLAFFILTAKPMDVVTNLDVFRPAPEAKKEQLTPPDVMRITVFPDGFTINDKLVDTKGLVSFLTKQADLNKEQTVLIQCINLAPHGKLVELLDLCSKLKLSNLSVVSSGGA